MAAKTAREVEIAKQTEIRAMEIRAHMERTAQEVEMEKARASEVMRQANEVVNAEKKRLEEDRQAMEAEKEARISEVTKRAEEARERDRQAMEAEKAKVAALVEQQAREAGMQHQQLGKDAQTAHPDANSASAGDSSTSVDVDLPMPYAGTQIQPTIGLTNPTSTLPSSNIPKPMRFQVPRGGAGSPLKRRARKTTLPPPPPSISQNSDNGGVHVAQADPPQASGIPNNVSLSAVTI